MQIVEGQVIKPRNNGLQRSHAKPRRIERISGEYILVTWFGSRPRAEWMSKEAVERYWEVIR